MSETQVLMTDSNFGFFFSRNHFLEGDFTFQWGGGSFLSGGCPMEASAGVGGGGLKKSWDEGGGTPPCLPHYGKPCTIRTDAFDESRFVMTFLTTLGLIEILCSFRLVLEEKTSKEIPESSRLEFIEKF